VISRSLSLAGGSRLLLLGPVRGLATEAASVTASLDSFAPESLGVSVSPEELRGFVDYFLGASAEPFVPLTSTEVNEVRGLCRFGEVRVPNPSVLAALEWSRARSLPVAPLDPGEEEAAALFTEHIGYLELVRRTVRERKLGREPPRPSSADAFALAWDRSANPGRGSRRLSQAREALFARAVERLGQGRGRVAALVDRERFAGVVARLDPNAPPLPEPPVGF
jgi:hypothetical protein